MKAPHCAGLFILNHCDVGARFPRPFCLIVANVMPISEISCAEGLESDNLHSRLRKIHPQTSLRVPPGCPIGGFALLECDTRTHPLTPSLRKRRGKSPSLPKRGI